MCSIKSGSIETIKYKKCVIINMIAKTTDMGLVCRYTEQ